MSTFTFNQLYVIESLSDNEKHTGRELYDDIIHRQEFVRENFFGFYKPIQTKHELLQLLDEINSDCINEKSSPILHFEIHGNQEGLVLNSNELVTWHELSDELRKINISTRNNLFITLAVCYGAYLMQAVRLDMAAPFYGCIGSFDIIYSSDLLIRYTEFYQELFCSLKVHEAYIRFTEVVELGHSTYKYLCAEEIFDTIYRKYIAENTTKKRIKERVKSVELEKNIKFKNRQERRKFESEFKTTLIKTKRQYYNEHIQKFFMIDLYGDNLQRFKIPLSLDVFLNKRRFWE